ncbi:MAG: hypothetical protein U1F26_19060 [Lysobacterales bacterium]
MNAISNRSIRLFQRFRADAVPRLVRGQLVAVISGDGQGWMARVLEPDVQAPGWYWVELSDGRRLLKLDHELEEQSALRDASLE